MEKVNTSLTDTYTNIVQVKGNDNSSASLLEHLCQIRSLRVCVFVFLSFFSSPSAILFSNIIVLLFSARSRLFF